MHFFQRDLIVIELLVTVLLFCYLSFTFSKSNYLVEWEIKRYLKLFTTKENFVVVAFDGNCIRFKKANKNN